MKKIFIALTFIFATLGIIQAQTTDTTKKERKHKVKVEKDAQSPAVTGLKKDGTPDMRLKANKNKVQTLPQTQPLPSTTSTSSTTPVQPQPQPKTQTSNSSITKSADKVLETDTKGRAIYQGPRGGKYYITKTGKKEYIKQ